PGPLDWIDVAMLDGGNRFEGAVSLPAGSLRTFVATATDRFGNAIRGAGLTWGVEGGIGAITSNGQFTASTHVGCCVVDAPHTRPPWRSLQAHRSESPSTRRRRPWPWEGPWTSAPS